MRLTYFLFGLVLMFSGYSYSGLSEIPLYHYKGKSKDGTHWVSKGRVYQDENGCWLPLKKDNQEAGQVLRFKNKKEAKEFAERMNNYLRAQESGSGGWTVRKVPMIERYEVVSPDGKVVFSTTSEGEANEMADIFTEQPPIMGPCM